jgi:hypothetical protein
MTTSRSSIYARFRLGEITQEEAEAEAQAAGIGTLECHPDPADFDPMPEPRWTLPMTLAWIIYRSVDSVRALMDCFQAATRVWRHIEYLENGKATKRIDLVSSRKSPLAVINEAGSDGIAARDDLLRKLKSGELQAFGIGRGESMHTPISPITWETITTFFLDEPRIQASDIGTFLEENARFQEVRVESSKVRELWPKLPSSSKAATDCRKWLIDQMKASPAKPKPKREFRAEALKLFDRLSVRQFNSAWDRAAQDSGAVAWTRAGRPKK